MSKKERKKALEGWLEKKETGISNWFRRYFHLDILSCKLSYYASDAKASELGGGTVTSVLDIAERGGLKKKFRFNIVTSNGIVEVHCQSEKTKRLWFETLRSTIAANASAGASFDAGVGAGVDASAGAHAGVAADAVAAGAAGSAASVGAVGIGTVAGTYFHTTGDGRVEFNTSPLSPAILSGTPNNKEQFWNLKSSNISKVRSHNCL